MKKKNKIPIKTIVVKYCPRCKEAPKKNMNVKALAVECYKHRPNFISTNTAGVMVQEKFLHVFMFMTTKPLINFYP